MPLVQATPRWSDFQHQPGKSSSITFDVIGAKTSVEAATANLVPRQNDTCQWDPLLSAESPRVTRPGLKLWQVTVVFSPGKGGSTQPPEQDPLKQPPKFRWNFSNTSEPFNRDIWENLIINTAGEPDESPFPKDVRATGFTVTKNFPPDTDFFNLAESYQDKLNKKAVKLFGIYSMKELTLRCVLFAPTVEFDNTVRFIPAAATFEYRADGWKVRKQSVGRNGWTDDNGTRRLAQLYDAKNNPVSTPIPLKEDGTPLNDGYKVGFGGPAPLAYHKQIPKNIKLEKSPDGSIFMLYDQYTSVDFQPLGKLLS